MKTEFPSILDYNQTLLTKGSGAFMSLGRLSLVPSRSHPIKHFLFGSGSYAVVFKGQERNVNYAIRCFLPGSSSALNRTKLVTDFLGRFQSPWKVKTQFLEQEIRVNNALYPVVLMDWVDGVLLNQFVTDNLMKSTVLSKLQEQLVEISEDLELRQVGHGDLQCGNIMVQGTPDRFQVKLIDYDGMYVPTLGKAQSQENGRSEFQHPKRPRGAYDHEVDRFSVWVMITALEAIKHDPSLWAEVMRGGFNTLDNFLFTAADFRDPEHSKLFLRLRQIKSNVLTHYVERLQWFCAHEPFQVTAPTLHSQSQKLAQTWTPPSPAIIAGAHAPATPEEVTIISTTNRANVLTSAFIRLGSTPLKINKQAHLGKTLIVSNGTELQRITILPEHNVIRVTF